jgi:RNA polymerase sigma-70 factor, ECF subfamily
MAFVTFNMAENIIAKPRNDEYSALLQRVAEARDRTAFAALFDHFAPRVKSFMMRKGSNAEQAEDLVQEAMIAVWTKAAMFSSDRGSVSTWIFTIARNLRIDRLRREKSQLYTDLEDFDAPDLRIDAEQSLGRSQEDNHVAQALAQIPEEQRALLILSYVEDVKSRMRLGYRRMRKLLETMT